MHRSDSIWRYWLHCQWLYIVLSRTKIGNLKWQIGRDINPVTFGKFVTSLVQKLKILGFYKNCKSSYWLQVSFLPPATKLQQGNVFTPVCHSVHRGCLSHPGQTPSWADTPGQTSPLGRPPGKTPPLPGQTYTPWADTPPAQYMLGYGQQTGVMHPTGMHSCYLIS